MTNKMTPKRAVVVAGIALGSLGIGWHVLRLVNRPPMFELYVFQLKSSVALFIRTPDDRRIVVNGGPNSEIVRRITHLLPFYSRRIDTIIATDEEAKDLTGLVEILHRYDVGRAVVSRVTPASAGIASSSSSVAQVFLGELARLGIPLEEALPGSVIELGAGVRMKPLFPVSPDEFAYSVASPPQMVMRIEVPRGTMLFVGDASAKIQKYVASSSLQPADVLIISRSAATDMADELLDRTVPTYLVHSRAPQKISMRAQSSLRKKPEATLLRFNDSRVFNLREPGIVRIYESADGLRIMRR